MPLLLLLLLLVLLLLLLVLLLLLLVLLLLLLVLLLLLLVLLVLLLLTLLLVVLLVSPILPPGPAKVGCPVFPVVFPLFPVPLDQLAPLLSAHHKPQPTSRLFLSYRPSHARLSAAVPLSPASPHTGSPPPATAYAMF
jgi:hypothetical protein